MFKLKTGLWVAEFISGVLFLFPLTLQASSKASIECQLKSLLWWKFGFLGRGIFQNLLIRISTSTPLMHVFPLINFTQHLQKMFFKLDVPRLNTNIIFTKRKLGVSASTSLSKNKKPATVLYLSIYWSIVVLVYDR